MSHKNHGAASEDVSHDCFSVEVKHRNRVPALLAKAFEQAKTNAPEGKVPLVVFHGAGERQYMAFLDLNDLVDLIALGPPGELDPGNSLIVKRTSDVPGGVPVEAMKQKRTRRKKDA